MGTLFDPHHVFSSSTLRQASEQAIKQQACHPTSKAASINHLDYRKSTLNKYEGHVHDLKCLFQDGSMNQLKANMVKSNLNPNQTLIMDSIDFFKTFNHTQSTSCFKRTLETFKPTLTHAGRSSHTHKPSSGGMDLYNFLKSTPLYLLRQMKAQLVSRLVVSEMRRVEVFNVCVLGNLWLKTSIYLLRLCVQLSKQTD